ncbi:MAG: PKD domain-containing protein, partial [Candidatus Binataceae bacterium]
MGAFARMTKNSANWMTMDNQVWNAIRNALRFAAPLLLACFALLTLNACGGGASGITIEIQPNASQNLDQNQQVTFTATLANDTRNQGVTWKVTGTNCSGNGCGTLSNVANTSVTYTAPAGFSTALVATLTATAVANTNVTSTVTISVVLPLTI